MKKVLKTALLCFLDVLLIFAIAALFYFGFNLRLTSLGIGILMFLFGYILKRIIFRDPQKRKLQKEKNKSIQKKIILQSIENNEQAPEKLSKNKANDFAEALNSGKSVKMSLSEIVDVIMDIDLAKKALPDSKFKEVYKLYNIYKHNTDKLSIDLSIYHEMVFEIIKRFEAIAPFAQYSNLSESEISYIMGSNQVKAPTPQLDFFDRDSGDFDNFSQQISDLFSDYFDMFICSPQLTDNPHRKPITAAYLFVIFDFIALVLEKRELSYKILSTIEDKLLAESELECYAKCVDIFGSILKEEISPRGDWMFYNGDESNWLKLLYICYGDLVRYPDYIFDYENSPIKIEDAFELMTFSKKFSATILTFTAEFTEVFSEKLK